MGKEGKLILMATKKPPNWQEWNEMKTRKQAIKESITMIQTEAKSIFDDVMGAESDLNACEILKARLPDRRHLTYWLGQIGRRKDARLGRNLDYRRYVIAVVENLRSQQEEVVAVTTDQDKKPKRKIVKHLNATSDNSQKSDTDNTTKEEEPMNQNREWNNSVDDSDQLQPIPLPSVVNSDNDQGQESEPNPSTPALPPIPGFHLEDVSRNQQYAIRNTLMFADCCVHTSAEGVFDVLARNIDSTGGLIWWLWRIGKRSLAARVKGKDLVDALRVAAYTLHKELKAEIGLKLPRW